MMMMKAKARPEHRKIVPKKLKHEKKIPIESFVDFSKSFMKPVLLSRTSFVQNLTTASIRSPQKYNLSIHEVLQSTFELQEEIFCELKKWIILPNKCPNVLPVSHVFVKVKKEQSRTSSNESRSYYLLSPNFNNFDTLSDHIKNIKKSSNTIEIIKRLFISGLETLHRLQQQKFVHKNINTHSFVVGKKSSELFIRNPGLGFENFIDFLMSDENEEFIAQEVFDNEEFTLESDIFSFGMVFKKILSNQYDEIEAKFKKEVPKIVNLIEAMLNEDPKKRPEIHSMLKDLKKVTGTEKFDGFVFSGQDKQSTVTSDSIEDLFVDDIIVTEESPFEMEPEPEPEAFVPPIKTERSMYYIGGKSTSIDWGKGIVYDSPFKGGDLGKDKESIKKNKLYEEIKKRKEERKRKEEEEKKKWSEEGECDGKLKKKREEEINLKQKEKEKRRRSRRRKPKGEIEILKDLKSVEKKLVVSESESGLDAEEDVKKVKEFVDSIISDSSKMEDDLSNQRMSLGVENLKNIAPKSSKRGELISSTVGVAKLILCGSIGTGKSSLMHRFQNNTFNESYKTTIGVDFAVKKMPIKGSNKSIKLQVWDTAGQERFRTMTSNYYRGSNGVLIVFDVSSKQSFVDAMKWFEEVIDLVDESCEIYMVGNKSDLKEREVSRENAEEFCKGKGITYFEASAKSGENVEKMFKRFSSKIGKKMELRMEDIDHRMDYGDASINLSKSTKQKRSGCFFSLPRINWSTFWNLFKRKPKVVKTDVSVTDMSNTSKSNFSSGALKSEKKIFTIEENKSVSIALSLEIIQEGYKRKEMYSVEKVLGVGGQSTCYLVSLKDNNEGNAKFAMKRYKSTIDEREFQNEVKAMKKFSSHHCIVDFIESFSYVDEYGEKANFLIMKYYNSGDLQRLLRRAKRKKSLLPLDVVLSFVEQFLKGIEHIHSNGWIHHDLKSANIFIDKDEKNSQNRLVIGDFGFCCEENEKEENYVKGGSPRYMSFEMMRGVFAKKYLDIFSAGTILIEMFLKKLTDMKTVVDVEEYIDHSLKLISQEFREILKSCFKEPSKRPSSKDLLLFFLKKKDDIFIG